MTFSDQAANELLKPNVLLQRRYTLPGTPKAMTLLLDQVKDAQAMLGHYPPVCYRGLGQVLVDDDGRELDSDEGTAVTLHMAGPAGAMDIPAMVYTFEDKGRGSRQMIFNFLILPSGRFVTRMAEVDRAAADFGQRCYGAAQLQFAFGLPKDATKAEILEQRDENQKTVETFLAALGDLLRVIYSGGRS